MVQPSSRGILCRALGLTLLEYAPDWIGIGYPSPENGFLPEVDVRAFQGNPEAETSDFETFALAAIRNTCAADGLGETIHCDVVRQHQRFTTDAGLEGDVLYFDRVHETTDPQRKEVEAYGPVFLFDLSGRTTGEEWIALVVQPMPTLDLDVINDRPLFDVARTVEVASGPMEDRWIMMTLRVLKDCRRDHAALSNEVTR